VYFNYTKTMSIKRYTLDAFKEYDISDHKIEDAVIAIINKLALLVGAPEYRKTPIFKKKDNRKNIHNTIIERDWKVMRNFQTTVISKNDEGINKKLGDIRINLNKLTKNSYDTVCKDIMDILKDIINETLSEEELNDIGKSIFETSTTNKFWSHLYSQLYKDILDVYPVFRAICDNNLDSFMELFNNVRYVNPEEDYDLFCTINKENEKRKALSNFFVNMMNQDIVSVDKMGGILVNLITKFNAGINNDKEMSALDEIGENVILLVKGGFYKLSTEFADYACIAEFITKITEIDCTKHKGVSSRITFKFMDLVDEL
jgi:hypothetical protein